MDKERTEAVLGTTFEEQRKIIFIPEGIRDAIKEPDDDDDDDDNNDDDLNIDDELNSGNNSDGDGDGDDDEPDGGLPGGDAADNRSTSFRHFVGITEIQANLLIGILNTSRAIQQESLDLWRNTFADGSLNSSTGEQSDKVVEIHNNFNGDISFSDSEKISTIAERLANETVSQMRAVGIRI